MYTTKLTFAALLASSMFMTGAASAAAQIVDFSPTANNNGQGAIGAAANFSAVGFQSDMASVLTSFGNSGTVNVSETGYINLTSFQDGGGNAVVSGVNSAYTLGATFSLTGTGTWTGSQIQLNAAGASFNVNLYANGGVSNPGTGTLIGTATLDPFAPTVAFAIAFGCVTNGCSGSALTSLSATLNFDPVDDFAGPNGFFQAPDPLMIDFAIGNAGGNTFNTGYSVNGTTVTFVNPLPGSNMGTANVTFVAAVPEPGALPLVGLALCGLAFVGWRKAKAGDAA